MHPPLSKGPPPATCSSCWSSSGRRVCGTTKYTELAGSSMILTSKLSWMLPPSTDSTAAFGLASRARRKLASDVAFLATALRSSRGFIGFLLIGSQWKIRHGRFRSPVWVAATTGDVLELLRRETAGAVGLGSRVVLLFAL